MTSGRFRLKAAYDPACECGIYVREDLQGAGVGRRLYATMLPELHARGFHRATAAIALPNPASIALHEAVGFRHVGTMTEIGHKLGRFWDVAWFLHELDPNSDTNSAWHFR